jgi:AcrR family transcriptional regulator
MQARQLRQQTLSDARKALVLDAARAVFIEAGIEGASIREIAKRAGYTPGAIYSYFDSKEAIYGELLAESLERLNSVTAAALLALPADAELDERAAASQQLRTAASAWFGFYADNPRDLDLGFYLAQGMQPRGLSSELNQQLNSRLYDALRPCEEAMTRLGLNAADARSENTALFAHGVGLLLLQHTGRIRMFGQQARPLFETYAGHLVQRLDHSPVA